ncbi:tumor necrosis factor receptor superfamily member 10B isoform X6 [Coregonus clupeaformis]|uniref:tumor necrosis factor receptor superfamily member 10B isoform X6 n=1 Tax=Coregonus clupeaformis TaxID=59861 RepID=UPI001E1C29D6|nr:tumor necrosis factor receptor superfamily member 10B isoform X6 [Coregonus clupeaformis]
MVVLSTGMCTTPLSMSYIHLMVVLIIWALNPMAAAQSGLELAQTGGSVRNRRQRDISCRENLEYPHDNICCLNCPAGKYVKVSCTGALEKGTCEDCDFDTYTEHDNGLQQCLKCTKCRSDQVTTKTCTITQNTECQCKPGYFCAPDQACEVCKKCSRCKDNEVRVKNCTTTSNTVCKTRMPTSSTISGKTPGPAAVIVIVVVVLSITAAIAGVYWKRRKHSKRTDSQNNPSETLEVVVDDQNNRSIEERQNNQNAVLDGTQLHPLLEQTQAEDVLIKLSPLNGDESLKKSFELFEELDVNYHNRFFRHIGLSDNAIKSTAHLHSEDRVYELLKVWLEKVGMEADINDLIKALLYFDQRLSAENIISKAIENSYYEYAEK